MTFYDRILALTGIIPPFVLLWFAERFERRIKEPTQGWRYRVLAASGLASVPIAWTERLLSPSGASLAPPWAGLFDAYVVSASVEELGKVICLLLLTRGVLAPRTRYAAFLYAIHAAMGFALVENVLAMLKSPDLAALSSRFFLRAYMTVPMHLVAGGLFGYQWASRTFAGRERGVSIGLACAIGLHGTYNALLVAIDALPSEKDTLRLSLAGVAMCIPVLGAVMLRLIAGRLRALDDADEAAQGGRPRSVPPIPSAHAPAP
ncbi:MAG: PrsW family glutamic-type intramembrane protease [Polyangiales bacterium]